MLENHHPHHVHTPTPSYPPLYQGRPDPHRGPHFHSHHHQQHYHPHLAPPPLPPPMPLYAQLHHHATVGAAGNKKKTWNFIHEKMSYDTFFTMKRLIERSHRGDEVLRWVTQNPGKISHNHYPIALQKIGQLLHAGAAGGGGGDSEAALVPRAGGGVENEGRQILEHQDFQTLCDSIVRDCAKFDNFSIVNCLYAVAALGEARWSHGGSLK